jgi:hypothetical protein
VGEEPLVVGDGYPDRFLCIQAIVHLKPYLTSPPGHAQKPGSPGVNDSGSAPESIDL